MIYHGSMTIEKFDNIYIICAHPDDEVIFFGPFLRYHNPLNSHFVTCLTCSDNIIRRSEFVYFLSSLKIKHKIFNFPIKRGFNIFLILKYFLFLIKNFHTANGKTLIITHSIYGDDHFHPQHIFLSFACLLLAKSCNYSLINSNNHEAALLYLRTLKLSFTKILKVSLFKLSLFIYRSNVIMTCNKSTLDFATMAYKSQNLGYPSFLSNKFTFTKLF